MLPLPVPEKPKNKGGRPKKPIKVDIKKIVYELAITHHTNAEIGALLGLSKDTVADRYSDILAKGRAEGKSRLRKVMMATALNGNVTLMIFMAKNYLGMSDSPNPLLEDETLEFTA